MSTVARSLGIAGSEPLVNVVLKPTSCARSSAPAGRLTSREKGGALRSVVATISPVTPSTGR